MLDERYARYLDQPAALREAAAAADGERVLEEILDEGQRTSWSGARPPPCRPIRHR